MDVLLVIVGVWLCVGVLPGLLLGLALAHVPRKPTRPPEPSHSLDLIAQQVSAWVAAGRLAPDVAQQLRHLIDADRAALRALELPVVPPQTPPAAAVSYALEVAPAVPNVSLAPDALPEAPPPVPVASVHPEAPSPVSPPAPTGAAQPQRQRLAGALLALGTRRTLLYLGTFLLVLSGLTLVVFNWASFPPPMQTAMLVGITAAIWGAGAWMTGRPDLTRAGMNLQAVAGLLVPVAAFAFTRPGMLDLAPRTGWLFVALACLPIYAVAAGRTRNRFYSAAAALAGVNALLAGLSGVPFAWLPTWLIGLLTVYVLLVTGFKTRGRPDLASGLYWVAHIGAPLALFAALALWFAASAEATAVAGAWAATAIFYSVAAWGEERRIWGWLAALTILAAVYSNLIAWFADVQLPLVAPVLAALAVFGLHIALVLRPRRPNIWVAPLVVAMIPAVIALGMASTSAADARVALPILMFGGFQLLRAARRGRLDGLPVAATDLDLLGFGLVAALGPYWFGAMLELAELTMGPFWSIMLTLALPAFGAAYWWPGRLRPAYDWTLQIIGGALVIVSGAILLYEPAFWRTTSALLALILVVQALLRRHRVWAALALGSVVLVGMSFLERAGQGANLSAWQVLGLGYTAVYALGATLLRRRLRAEWLAPALVGAAGIGGATAAIALYSFVPGIGGVACLTLVALGSLLIVLSRLWREARLGYPAVTLLAIGLLAAASQGFFTGWTPGGALSHLVLITAVLFGAAGLFLRRRAPTFALPYEAATLVLLPLAPLASGGAPLHLTIVWIALAAIYALISERYRQAWFALAGWICLDLALLQGLAWQAPQLSFAHLGIALAGLAWVQGGVALIVRPGAAEGSFRHGLVRVGFIALALSGGVAVLLALPEALPLAVVAWALLILLALVATLVQSVLAAWLTLPLLALGLSGLHTLYDLPLTSRLLGATWAALIVALCGWAFARSAAAAALVWKEPLRLPPLLVGLSTAPILGFLYLWDNDTLGLSLALLLWSMLWAIGGLRERRPWATLPATTAANLALLSLLTPSNGLFPFNLLIGVAFALAACEGGAAAVLRRTMHGRVARIGAPLYSASGFMGFLALLFALGAPERFAAVALGLAVLIGILTTIERREAGVWAALTLSIISYAAFGTAQNWPQGWLIAWLPLALLAHVALGVILERLGWVFWRRPTTIGVAFAGGFAVLILYGNMLASAELDFLQAALIAMNLGLLWAAVAVRIRSLYLAYAAGAAFVGAALCRLADLDVAEPQWYVVPAGLYLLALGAGLRRFQGRRRVSQVLEFAAALLIMGTSATQALRIPGGPGYELILFGEALAFIGYGALLRLQAPFVMGIAFFVAAASWLALEVSRGFNQWVLLGIFGILMIMTYVILERHQERLVRLGRTWMLELRSWA